MTEQEEWRDIPGFEGRYQASSLGRIRSTDWKLMYPARCGRTHHIGRPVKPWLNKRNGYFYIALGAKCKKEVHRLIALTFVGPCPEDMQVNHKDGNKQNNCSSNLEYVSCGDNHVHALITRGKFGYLENSKLSAEQVLSIYDRLLTGAFVQDLAVEYGVDRHTISGIKTRERWTYLTKELPDIPKIHWRHKEKR